MAVSVYVLTYHALPHHPVPGYSRPAALAVLGVLFLIGVIHLTPSFRGSRRLAIGSLGVDTAAALALVWLYSPDPRQYPLAPLLLVVFEAGVISGVSGGLVVWAVTMIGYAAIEAVAGRWYGIPAEPAGVAMRATVGLLLALGGASVTGRRRAQENLKWKTDLHETLLQAQSHLGEGVVYVEGESIFYANDAFCELTGYDREELLDLPSLFTIVAPEEREPLEERIRRRESTGHLADHYEAVITSKAGGRVDVAVSVCTLQVEEPSQRVAIVRDIRERKEAEDALKRLVQYLNTLLEIDRETSGAASPDRMAAVALGRIDELVPCMRASITSFDHQAGTATALAVRMEGETTLGAGARIPLEDFKLTEDLRQGQVHVEDDLQALPNLTPLTRTLLTEGVRSCVVVPLISDGELVGSLNIGSADIGGFTQENMDALVGVGPRRTL